MVLSYVEAPLFVWNFTLMWYVSFLLIGFINCWSVQDYLNVKFKETGHSNMYFPQVELLFQPVESSSFDICFPCELEFHYLVTVSVTWNMKFLVNGRLGVGHELMSELLWFGRELMYELLWSYCKKWNFCFYLCWNIRLFLCKFICFEKSICTRFQGGFIFVISMWWYINVSFVSLPWHL